MQWKKEIHCSSSKAARATSSLPYRGGPQKQHSWVAVRHKGLGAVLLHLAKTPKWLFWEAHRWEEPHSTMLAHSRIQHTWLRSLCKAFLQVKMKMKTVTEGPRWASFMFYWFLRLSYPTASPLLLLLFYKLFLVNRIKWCWTPSSLDLTACPRESTIHPESMLSKS